MGDRMTFGFVHPGGDVLYLYSHNGGGTWAERLSDAMHKAGVRREDSYYANRIMVSRLIGEDWKHSTGYGFSINEILDNDYSFIPVVDWSRYEVSVYMYDDDGRLGHLLVTFPIGEFVDDPYTASKMVNKLVDAHV